MTKKMLVPYKISTFRINYFIVSLLIKICVYVYFWIYSQEFRLAIVLLFKALRVFINESFFYRARPTGTLHWLVLKCCIHKNFECLVEKCFLQFYFRIYFSMRMEYAPRMLIIIFRNHALKTIRFMINLCPIHRKTNRAKMILK